MVYVYKTIYSVFFLNFIGLKIFIADLQYCISFRYSDCCFNIIFSQSSQGDVSFFLFFWPHSMQDLGSPARGQTRTPRSGSTES